MHKGCARSLPGILALATVAVGIAGCSVKSFDSGRDPAMAKETVQSVRVTFVDNPDGSKKSSPAVDGLIALAAIKYLERKGNETNDKARAQFDQVFQDGFKDKFPAQAASYGLTVADTAQTELRVTLGNQKTQCSLYGCASRFDMQGDLVDSSGKSVWHFTTEIGQSSIFAEIPPLFDKFSTEVLNAMKKDGVIGK